MKDNRKKFLNIAMIISLCAICVVGTVFMELTLGNKRIVSNSEWKTLMKLSSDIEKEKKIQKHIQDNYYLPVDEQTMQRGRIDGMFSALHDPYSQYLDAEMFKTLKEHTSGVYAGLGIVIEPAKDGFITVVSPIEDTPAYKAGIKTGDKIYKVNDVEYGADKINEAVSVMKGKAGEDVKLNIIRNKEEIEMRVTRALISLKSVKTDVLQVESVGDIGYIRITSFDEKVFNEFVKKYNELLEKNIKGFILDLRGNPGGDLNQCVKLSDYILGEGTIVSVKYRSGKEDVYKSDKNKVNLPFVVLVDKGSASASEILSGAIQDNHAAKLVGTTTFGKGLVQQVMPWGKGEALKLTIAQYFTPSGAYIHGKGIEPDYKVELSEKYNSEDRATDNQLAKALEVLKGIVDRK